MVCYKVGEIMENIEDEWDFLKRLTKMLAEQFGYDCEVVLHDLTKDYDHTIVAIENGHITGRRVGDCGSNLGLEVLRNPSVNGDDYNYVTQLHNGKLVKSSTTFLRDSSGKVIGSLCINYNITGVGEMIDKLRNLSGINPSATVSKSSNKEIFAGNIKELLENILADVVKNIGKNPEEMNRNDKKCVIETLDNKGVFLISKSSERVCEFLGISKFTLYNYLDQVRENTVDED